MSRYDGLHKKRCSDVRKNTGAYGRQFGQGCQGRKEEEDRNRIPFPKKYLVDIYVTGTTLVPVGSAGSVGSKRTLGFKQLGQRKKKEKKAPRRTACMIITCEANVWREARTGWRIFCIPTCRPQELSIWSTDMNST